MDHVDYYRRLAFATLELALECRNPESRRHLLGLAEDYRLRGESLVTRPLTIEIAAT
jgi:hypothetical protein